MHPHSQSLGGLESSRGRAHPQGQVCRRKPSPAQGGPLPRSPRDTQMGVPTQTCPQALDTRAHPGCQPFTAPSGSSRRGADLRLAHLLGRCAHHLWPDPRVCRDRRPPPQTVLPGAPTHPALSVTGGSRPFLPSLLLPVCLSARPTLAVSHFHFSLDHEARSGGNLGQPSCSWPGLVDQAQARETPRAGWGQVGSHSSRNRGGTPVPGGREW